MIVILTRFLSTLMPSSKRVVLTPIVVLLSAALGIPGATVHGQPKQISDWQWEGV